MDCSAAISNEAARIVVCLVQPPDWRIYITPALVFLSVCIAFLALRTQRAIARERATVDLIEKMESGDHYRKIVRVFSDLKRGAGFSHLSNPKSDEDKEQRPPAAKPPTLPLEANPEGTPKLRVNDIKPLFDFDSVTINTKITSQWHLSLLISRLEKLMPMLPAGAKEEDGGKAD